MYKFWKIQVQHQSLIFFSANDEPVPEEVLAFEAKVRPGLGDKGKGVSLPKEQTEEDIKEQMKHHSFNKYVSDVISLKRDLPDTRHQQW